MIVGFSPSGPIALWVSFHRIIIFSFIAVRSDIPAGPERCIFKWEIREEFWICFGVDSFVHFGKCSLVGEPIVLVMGGARFWDNWTIINAGVLPVSSLCTIFDS
jgi:hypothetical protein